MTARLAMMRIELPPWLMRLAMSPMAWCLAAVVWIGVREYLQNPDLLLKSLGDTDDATRLIQVRELIAGASWFDTTIARIGGPTPLVSHWSRLIDWPLALLMRGFGLVMSQPAAELATRITWPLLTLLALLRLTFREAEIRSGRAAGAIMIGLTIAGLISIMQFNIGRIDHHNAMIFGAVGGLLMLARAFEDDRCGWPAGFLLGLSLAVGYEGLGIIVPAIAIASVASVHRTQWLDGVRKTATGMAVTLAIAIVATIAPGRWLISHCDALSLNLALLITSGALGLSLIAARARHATLGLRLGLLAATAAVGAAAYIAAGPQCLAGPYGAVDPAVREIWLDKVHETFNIVRLWQLELNAACVYMAFSAIAIAAQAWSWQRRRTIDATFVLALVVIAAVLGLCQVKFMHYATWLENFAIATAVADAPAMAALSVFTIRLAGLTVMNQLVIAGIVSAFLSLVGAAKSDAASAREADFDACRGSRELPALAQAPAGLIVADVDFGPYIAALTPHSVLSAPYHRIDKAILAADRIFTATPSDAEKQLRAVGATYVFGCALSAPTDKTATAATDPSMLPKSLHDHLAAGTPPAFLARVELPGAAPQIRLWRVLPH